MLGVGESELLKWAFRKRADRRYVIYSIPKANGKTREIAAPKAPLKDIQRRLLRLLEPATRFSESVHGFVPSRSIVSNAQRHVRSRHIYKVDIDNFFPSISLKRVHRMFQSYPFHFSDKIALTLAKLCTFEGKLPQGAPTSPFISNVILKRFDSRLRTLAKKHQVVYTRYADDIVISTRRGELPASLLVPQRALPLIQDSVASHLDRQGFRVNLEKTRVINDTQRMRVTGVTVNRKLNVSREFVRRVRKLIHLIKRKGIVDANAYFLGTLDEKRHRRKVSTNAILSVVHGRIAHIEQVRGKGDDMAARLRRELAEALNPGSTDPLLALSRSWNSILNEPNGQVRGYRLEDFWGNLASHFELNVVSPFTAAGEQVDGAIVFDDKVFLVECKATKSPPQPKHVDALYGKLDRRPGNVWGIFVSMYGYSPAVADVVREYSNKRIIFFAAAEIEQALSGKQSLGQIIAKKVEDLSIKRLRFRFDR